MPLTTGPCQSWPLDLGCCKLPDGTDPALIAKWQAVATKILWSWSGRRIGLCDVVARPCKKSCMEQMGITTRWGFAGPYLPYIDSGGVWRNATCGCTSDCSCGELCEVYLPGSPVHDIVEITIDGQVIDPATYRVDAAGKLVRQALPAASPGEEPPSAECWPACQDLSRPADEQGTFVVRYRWGIEPDEAAIAAVSELTCHLVRACLPAGADCPPCQLPGNVRRVARQGVVVEMADPTTIFAERRTNLPTVDMWLQAENPHGLAYPPRVLSPDHRRPRVQVWP